MRKKELLNLYKGQPFAVRLYVFVRMFFFDINKIVSHFPSHATSIMELACGWGLASFVMANQYKNAVIHSYDINEKRIMTLNALNPYPNLKFHHQSVLDIGGFNADGVFISDLLHHLPYDKQYDLLKKIHASSPANLVLIIKDMDKGRYSFRQFLNYLIDIVHAGGFIFYYRRADSFVKLFNDCGFKVRRMEPINSLTPPLKHVLFILEKN